MNQKLTAILLALMVSVVASPGLVSADSVFNNVDGSIDTTVEVLNLTVGGVNGSVMYKVHPTNGDGENGCNLDGGQLATFSVASANPAAATVSPSSITFTGPGCGDSQTITVTPVGVGDADITLSETANTAGGTFTVDAAKFTAHVTAGAPSDVTPPVIVATVSPDANANGWHSSDVTVSWTVTDGESAISSSSGCDTTILTAETAGTTLTCTATSDGGTSSDSVTIKIDKTAPVVTGSRLPLANTAGWNNTDVVASFMCADTGSVQSDIDVDTVAGTTVSTEGADQSVTSTGDCIDNAGNAAVAATVSNISIDKTAPDVTITTPADGAKYIRNHVVLADWAVSDALSGINASATTATAADGSAIDTATLGIKAFTVSATDLAGNMTSVTNSYTVETYTFNGFQSPLTLSLKDFKKTSTIPVKIKLSTSDGVTVTDAVAQLYIDKTTGTPTTPAVSSGNSNTLNYFRYDLTGAQYIFNLSTKVLSTVGTYKLRVTLDDGTEQMMTIVVR